MAIKEIPLTAENQQFSINIAGTTYRFRFLWREQYWIVDLEDASGIPLICGTPLVVGADLLAQYEYMALGFRLMVVCDDATQDYPTKTDLGQASHLLIITE
ncbi:phage baseplate plug family protein [Salmonella enterica]